MRKPFEGVRNVILFNWHYFAIAFCIAALAFVCVPLVGAGTQLALYVVCGLVLFSVFISLLVTTYIYDFSSFYSLAWIDKCDRPIDIVNIHAGFDETSVLLKSKFPNATLKVFDFYNPHKHTEVSIERARKYFPPSQDTQQVDTGQLPLQNGSIAKVFLIFAAHEIRTREEQINFFKELHRVLKADGAIYVTEHLRDMPNFFAYNIGYFHFFAQQHWLKVFDATQLKVEKKIKTTPFITTYKLTKQ